MIYLIHAVGTTRYKIGFAVRPESRLKELQTGCPFPLQILAVREGCRNDEWDWHAHFAKHWVQGEWFEFSDPIAILVEFEGTPTHKKNARTEKSWNQKYIQWGTDLFYQVMASQFGQSKSYCKKQYGRLVDPDKMLDWGKNLAQHYVVNGQLPNIDPAELLNIRREITRGLDKLHAVRRSD